MSAPERTEEQTAKHNFQRDRAWYNIPRRISSCTLPCAIPGKYKRKSQINDQDFPSQRKQSTTHFLVCQVQASRTSSLHEVHVKIVSNQNASISHQTCQEMERKITEDTERIFSNRSREQILENKNYLLFYHLNRKLVM